MRHCTPAWVTRVKLRLKKKKRKKNTSWAQWLTLVISALWKAQAGGSLELEFKTNLDNIVRPHLYKKIEKKISWAWWCMPVVPATQEAAGWEDHLSPESQGCSELCSHHCTPAWVAEQDPLSRGREKKITGERMRWELEGLRRWKHYCQEEVLALLKKTPR